MGPHSLRRNDLNRWTTPLANSPPILLSFLTSILICIILLEAVVRWPIPEQNGLNRRVTISEGQLVAVRQVITAGVSSITAITSSADTSSSTDAAATTSVASVGEPNPAAVLSLTTESSTLAPSAADALSLTSQSTTVSVGVADSDSVLTLTTQSSIQTPKAATTIVASPSSAQQQATSSQASVAEAEANTSQSRKETSNGVSAGVSAQVTSSPVQAVSLTSDATAVPGSQPNKDVSSSVYAVSLTSGATASSGSRLHKDVASSFDVSSTKLLSHADSTVAQLTSTKANSKSTFGAKSTETALAELGGSSSGGRLFSTTTLSGTIFTASDLAASTSSNTLPTTSPQKLSTLKPSEIALSIPVTGFVYFTGTYLLTIIACLLKVSWLVIFACSKMYEPFHQLAQPAGAPADTSVLFEFLSTGFPVDHFRLGLTGNGDSWYMIWSTVVVLLMMVLPSLCSEAFSIKAMGYCKTDAGDQEPCDPAWVVDIQVVHILQALLAIMAVVVVIILFIRIRSRSNPPIHPISIDSIASLLTHQSTVAKFRSVDSTMSKAELAFAMHQRQFEITSTGDKDESSNPSSHTLISTPALHPPVHANSNLETIEPRPKIPPLVHLVPHLSVLVPGLLTAVLLIVIIAYATDHANDAFNNFFNSPTTFGAKFLLTISATILGIAYRRLEQEVRVLQPYRAMSHGHSQDAVNAPLHGSPITYLPSALARREWACAFVSGLAGWGVEVLSIAISGVPFKPGMIMPSYYTSVCISIVLLVLMGVAIGVVVWLRKSDEVELVRLPDTLAEICVLLSQDRINGVRLNEKANKHGEALEVADGEQEENIWRRAYGTQYRVRREAKKSFIESTVEVETAT